MSSDAGLAHLRSTLPVGIGNPRGARRSYLLRVAPSDLRLLDVLAKRARISRAEWVRLVLREQIAERLLVDCLRPVVIRKGFKLWRADGEQYAFDVLTDCGPTDGCPRAWVRNIAFGQPPERCRSGLGAVLVFPREPHAIYLVDLSAVPAVLRGGGGPPVAPVAEDDPGTDSRPEPAGREGPKGTRGRGDRRRDGSGAPAQTDGEIRERDHVSRAVGLLRDFLAVPRPSGDDRPDGVPAFARDHGIRRSTLRTAREALGVVAEKAAGTFRGGWTWRLPGCGAPSAPEGARTDETAVTAPGAFLSVEADPGGIAARTQAPQAAYPEWSAPAPPPAPMPRPCDAPGHLWAGRWIDWFDDVHCARCEPPDPRLARPTEPSSTK